MCARAARPGMGIATDQTFENKGKYRQFLDSFSGGAQAVEKAATRIFAPLAKISASHPINEAREGDGYFTDIIAPIANALTGLTRQNYVVIGGEYEGTEWVTSTGYYYGHFNRSLFGIPPNEKLAFLRFGEFHQMEAGKIIENWCMLDIPHLLLQLGFDLFAEIEKEVA